MAKRSNKTTGTASTPVGGEAGIRVRMYRVGFGDFFLLTLRAKDGALAHILIDCGVHAKPTNSIDRAIQQLEIDTGGELALIIMTHRHADHISGFDSGSEIFAKFKVGRVWMPWFESRTNPAALAFQARITALAQKLQLALAARRTPDDEQYQSMASNITGGLAAKGGGSSNERALTVLHAGFAGAKTPVDYYGSGDDPVLPDALAAIGLHAKVLGPPRDTELVKQMDNRNHQYLVALDTLMEGASEHPGAVFESRFEGSADNYDSGVFGAGGPLELQKAIGSMQPDMLHAAAAQADNTLNNQSLVILFNYNGKSMLFAGDAQWGNWSNFLFGGALGTPGHTTLTQSAKDILASIDFYKVGHHGSTNATPIDALEAMKNGVVAMCSTAEHAYGSEENKSEVPRKPLMAALNTKTNHRLARSDQVPVAGAPPIATPLDPAFVTPTNDLFIDYAF
ncbi:MBL fold metallo-hydrolase [Mesorhizobium sp.]|uniref:MBL fold metallo-hydrolase n=1 Tax=Mesorhizobium sp. TaxID=1871066 RepID=UPI000FE49250|nr:MBL fold metallo-hydrolase [Mesorhizobium sp.]RWE78117.1 MAG: MBL fold metallo-hydrolase [Mesorhizobium sp.]TIV32538.1 MAG: MBL fold metallo-hydrolase [Mesorhizobium sp.]